jgi:hypothetical protein
VLLTLSQPVDLINIDGSQAGAVPVGPQGVLEAGTNTQSKVSAGAGYIVATAGDVNNDGFDDILVGAPTVGVDANGLPVLGGGAGAVYLIFGSRSATTQSVSDWLNITPTNGNTIPVNPSPTATNAVFNVRDGDLSQLGNVNQTNPATNINPPGTQTPSFPFSGVTIINSSSTMKTALLGGSVAGVGDLNRDGFADFMVGAPGASTAFLVYGSAALANTSSQQLDLSNPNNIAVVTFQGVAGSQAGRSLANTFDFIQDGSTGDLAIGAPNASVSSASSGAVYVVSGPEVSGTPVTRTIDLSLLRITNSGASGSPRGIIIAGANPGDNLGFSVAGLGDIVSAKSTSQDLLIGAPAQGNLTTGAAYLIYAASPTALNTFAGNSTFISVQNLGDPATGATTIPGATFTGVNPGDYTGYAVAGIGDFNGDGLPDFAIGSPGYDNGTTASTTTFDGRVDVFFAVDPSGGKDQDPRYGTSVVTDSENATPNTAVGFTSASGGQAFGYSVAGVGTLNTNPNNELLIGAPGTSTANGTVFLVAGGSAVPASNVLQSGAVSTSGPLVYYPFFESQSTTRDMFGTSVAGLKFLNTPSYFDGDGVPDFLIGSAGLNVNVISPNAGGVYILESGLNVYRIATPSGGVNPPPPPPPSGGSGGASNRISLLGTSAVPEFGGALLPPPSSLARLRWKPLPVRVAYNQFLPSRPFLQRNRQFFHPTQQKPHGSAKVYSGYRTSTLGQAVFTRGKFPPGVHFGIIRHRGLTIPRTA